MLLQLVQLLLQGLELLRAWLWEGVRLRLRLRERVRWLLLLWERVWRLLRDLHDLLRGQVQDRVLRWLRRRMWLWGPLRLAEQQRAGVRVAPLAVAHLLLHVFCRCREGLQDLNQKQGEVTRSPSHV